MEHGPQRGSRVGEKGDLLQALEESWRDGEAGDQEAGSHLGKR